jgi:hypothetical protein
VLLCMYVGTAQPVGTGRWSEAGRDVEKSYGFELVFVGLGLVIFETFSNFEVSSPDRLPSPDYFLVPTGRASTLGAQQ